MARGVNKVILIGNLGGDPETRYMPSGGAVTNITLATSESWKDKQTGEPVERTEWHRVVFFNRLAEIAGEYLRKGSKTYIEGSLRTRKWQDQSGADKYTTEIVASEMQMLDSRSAGGAQGAYPDQQGSGAQRPQQASPQAAQRPAPNQPAQGQAPQGQAAQGQAAPQSAPPGGAAPAGNFDDFDDDIPF